MTGDNQDVLEFLNQTKAMYDEDCTNYRMCEQAIAAVTGIEKAAAKLAYIHQCIDLYCDREELHDESYWLDYILDPEWIDTDIGWDGYEMTSTAQNQSEPPTRRDLINRTAAIDAANAWFQAYANRSMSKVMSIQDVLRELPSAQPDHSGDVNGKVSFTEKERGMLKKMRTLHNGTYANLLDRLVASAQEDADSAYTEGYTAAESKYRKMWDEMQATQPVQEDKWDLFEMISSVWYGKQCYFEQNDGTVYSRLTGRYYTFEDAVKEFVGELKNG